MSSWNKLIGDQSERALSAPTWYARRAVIEDIAEAIDGEDSKKVKLGGHGTTFELGDSLIAFSIENGKVVTPGKVVIVKEVKDLVYTLEGEFPTTGKVMFVKFMDKSELVANKKGDLSYCLLPVTQQMLAEDKQSKTLRKLGIKSPGWYKWRQVLALDEKGAETTRVAHTVAQLLVSMKGFKEGTAFVPAELGRFDKDGEIEFTPEGITLQ